MGLLARLLTNDLQATWSPDDDRWYQPLSGPAGVAASGQYVNSDSAQKVSAFFRGLTVLSNDIAKLPLDLHERKSDGSRARASGHPLYDVLHSRPNGWQTSFEWRRQGMRSLILRGNWYNQIVPGARGAVDQLWPISPDLVTPEQLANKRIVYRIRDPETHHITTYTQDEIFHVRGVSDDGIEGQSILTWARDSVGIALATESYAGRLFSQGSLHGGTITVPGLLNDEASARMAKSFITSQSTWHLPKVIEQGATYTEPTLTPEDSQFLMSRKFSVTEMARWLGLPPHKIFDLDRSTNNNIEHQGIEYVGDGIQPWAVLIEQAISRDLIINPRRFYAQFNLEGLLRGDSAARGTFYEKLFWIGSISQNEIRKLENMNAIPDGDQYFVPATMRPSDEPFDPESQGPSKGVPDMKGPPATGKKDKSLAMAAAARLLRKETTAITKQAVKLAKDGDAWAVWVTEFYSKHVALVVETLQISSAAAEAYCSSQAAVVMEEGVRACEQFMTVEYAEQTATWALGLEAV